MNEQQALIELKVVNSLITDSHVVLQSGRHARIYFNKDELWARPKPASRFFRAIAERFRDSDVEVVAGPAIGGAILSQGVAYELGKMTNREVLSVYAERDEQTVIKAKDAMAIRIGEQDVRLEAGDEVVVRKPRLICKRGYDKHVADQRVLVVEDVLTTGDSARRAVEAVRSNQGNVIGVGVIFNRGGVTIRELAHVPRLEALVNMLIDSWSEEECKLTGPCSEGVPINTDVGHGRQLLERQQQSS